MDELVVGDRQLHDLASDLRGDFHDIGAHRAVARPRRAHVILPGLPAERGRGADGHHRNEHGQNAQGRPDGPALDRRRSRNVASLQDIIGVQLYAGHQRLQRAIIRTIDETMIT